MHGALIPTKLFGFLSRLIFLGLLALVFSFVFSTAVVSAQYCTPDQCDECNLCQRGQRCCHELPELWLINTRCAPRCSNLDNGFDCLSFKRYDRCRCCFVKENLESFLAQEATKPTLFYSHGNGLNHKNAMRGCWRIYSKMRYCPGPKRLVFWSWPAEKVHSVQGLRIREAVDKNLRTKYVYAEYQGYYMAKLVDQMSLSQRVMLSGHSYGAIAAASALHYMGGGCLRGLTLAGAEAVERPNLRAGLISAAFDNDMIIPGHRYGQAFVAGEKIFVTRNIRDSTLKKWPNTSWRGRQALGRTGVNANCLGEHRSKLCQQTMTSDVGKSHYLKPHLKSARFMSTLCCLAFSAVGSCPSVGEDASAEGDALPAGLEASFEDSEALAIDEAGVPSEEADVSSEENLASLEPVTPQKKASSGTYRRTRQVSRRRAAPKQYGRTAAMHQRSY